MKKPQGFAAMDPQRVREIASAGGRAAVRRYTFTPEVARAAAIKSQAVQARRRAERFPNEKAKP
jgi:general stress protein YciG